MDSYFARTTAAALALASNVFSGALIGSLPPSPDEEPPLQPALFVGGIEPIVGVETSDKECLECPAKVRALRTELIEIMEKLVAKNTIEREGLSRLLGSEIIGVSRINEQSSVLGNLFLSDAKTAYFVPDQAWKELSLRLADFLRRTQACDSSAAPNARLDDVGRYNALLLIAESFLVGQRRLEGVVTVDISAGLPSDFRITDGPLSIGDSFRWEAAVELLRSFESVGLIQNLKLNLKPGETRSSFIINNSPIGSVGDTVVVELTRLPGGVMELSGEQLLPINSCLVDLGVQTAANRELNRAALSVSFSDGVVSTRPLSALFANPRGSRYAP